MLGMGNQNLTNNLCCYSKQLTRETPSNHLGKTPKQSKTKKKE